MSHSSFFRYTAARNLLLNCRYKDEIDENKAHEKLLIVLSNLAICYLEKEDYKKVCCMFNDARYTSANRTYKNIKLLYKLVFGRLNRMYKSYEWS